MVFKSQFYGGSRILTPLADMYGLQIDQINFVAVNLVALVLAFPFRKYLSPDNVGVNVRHVVEVAVGAALTMFCFGSQIWHLLIQSLICYMLMAFGGPRFCHIASFVYAMLYLSVTHIYRQVYDYGGYTLDITGPMMIQTQKLTSLAFALHDGRYKKEEQLSKDQKEQAVRKLPNILQFLSFMFYFHGIMVGPTTFYNDYMAFISGKNFQVAYSKKDPKDGESPKHPTDGLTLIVLKKLFVAFTCLAVSMVLPPLFFPPEKLHTPEYYNMSFVYKMLFVLGVMTLAKQKYYFAWKFTDAINNAAGFGFSGYDEDGQPKWDLTDNVDIVGVELSTSLKINIDSWNKKTILWLRRVVYDRVPVSRTMAVFTVSALWHGFYPGYYITFFGGAACIITARLVRRIIRPWFQTSSHLHLLYDILTFVATRFANSYLCFPFLVLEFYACFFMYKSVFFCIHVIALCIFLSLNWLPKSKIPSRHNQAGNENTSKHAAHTNIGDTGPSNVNTSAANDVPPARSDEVISVGRNLPVVSDETSPLVHRKPHSETVGLKEDKIPSSEDGNLSEEVSSGKTSNSEDQEQNLGNVHLRDKTE